MNRDDGPTSACCHGASSCVFAKALFARSAPCGLARRRAVAEREVIDCASAAAQLDCAALERRLRERARFALKLRTGAPLLHAQALRLQCGGLQGLQRALASASADVHELLRLARQRHGDLDELPWSHIVQALVQWQPHARRRPARP